MYVAISVWKPIPRNEQKSRSWYICNVIFYRMIFYELVWTAFSFLQIDEKNGHFQHKHGIWQAGFVVRFRLSNNYWNLSSKGAFSK